MLGMVIWLEVACWESTTQAGGLLKSGDASNNTIQHISRVGTEEGSKEVSCEEVAHIKEQHSGPETISERLMNMAPRKNQR